MDCGCKVDQGTFRPFTGPTVVHCDMHEAAQETLELLSALAKCAMRLEGPDREQAHDELYSDSGALGQAVAPLAGMQKAGALAMPDAVDREGAAALTVEDIQAGFAEDERRWQLELEAKGLVVGGDLSAVPDAYPH